MAPMAPTPAKTQSCLARIVAVARRCGSMHAREVASLVALSSSSACSRIAVILRLCQSINLLCWLLLLVGKDAAHPDDQQKQDQRCNGECQLVNQQPIVFASSRTQKRRTRPIDELGKTGNQERQTEPTTEFSVRYNAQNQEGQPDNPIGPKLADLCVLLSPIGDCRPEGVF